MKHGPLRIVFLDGPRPGEELSFDKERVSLGRSPASDVVFDWEGSSSVSRDHAAIEKTAAGWRLTDTSRNGTYYFGGRELRGASRMLMDREELRLSKNGPRVEVILPAAGKRREKPAKDDPVPPASRAASMLFTKILPISRRDKSRSLRRNPFFFPGLLTVACGLALFVLLQAVLTTGARGIVYVYEVMLGLYLGIIMVYAVYRSSGAAAPKRFLVLPGVFTAAAIVVISYRYGEYLRFTLLQELMESKSLIPAFAGHFVGAGLFEELVKSLPVWYIALRAGSYSRKGRPGFEGKRMQPSAAVVIGSSSAAGFIVVETLLQYVPGLESRTEAVMGLMLLVPRFITGISGHVAWSGIFAYFICLAFIYRGWRGPLLALAGWVLAAFLHGMWNACALAELPALGAAVSIVSFVVFLMYINKAAYFRKRDAGEAAR